MSNYYEKVEAYYDDDAQMGFEDRAVSNPALERIRNAFRGHVKRCDFKTALEIGCGPGFDAEWFGRTWPGKQLVAIDVSGKMIERASRRMAGLRNVRVRQATEREVAEFPEAPFDLVFVFFGALNTVDDLSKAAEHIHRALRPGGCAVLTFVNKWYLRELLVNLLKLRFRTAFARIRTVWGGYSTTRFLASRCYAPSYIRKCFSAFHEREHRGFSIVYPAWYNHQKLKGQPGREERLWQLDQRLNRTPFWKFGEYTLFVFEKPAE